MTSQSVNIRRLAQKIASLKQEANEIKAMSGGIQAIDKNIDRILACIRMLEINISDLVDIVPDK